MTRSTKVRGKAGRGEIRRLWLAERDLFRDHLLRLDPLTRQQRFGTAVNDAFLDNYAMTTFGVGGLVYAFIEDGVVRGAAELRALTTSSRRLARRPSASRPAGAAAASAASCSRG